MLGGLVFFLASCGKENSCAQEGQPIYLSASLASSVFTKVPFTGSVPTTSVPLHVDVWASTTPEIFMNEGKDGSLEDGNVVAIHTKGSFHSGEPQLLSEAVYPPPRVGAQGSYTADPVYFVSMHPQGWTSDDGTESTYAFSGYEDVMFAPQVSGAYDLEEQNQVVTSSPELKFEHLLTRITVRMGVVLEDGESLQGVRDAWGEITGLRIRSYNSAGYLENLDKVTVDLSKGDAFDYDADVSFSGQKDGSMDFYALGTDDVFPSGGGKYMLTESMDSVAYVMCAPVVATAHDYEYMITVETANRGAQDLKLDLQKTASSASGTGSTRGNHFLVTLKFKKGRAVVLAADVCEWENGGYGTGNIED